MKNNLSNIKKAKYYLNKNDCGGIPTETVYWLAANAYSNIATAKIFRLKRRPNFNFKIFNKFKKIQLPVHFKKKKANFIIKNNFKNVSLKKNVKIIKKKILKNERSNPWYRNYWFRS